MPNIYYDPESFGLTTVGSISLDENRDDYGFDMVVVWKRKRGEYFAARDSGCSCPSPFEDMAVGDLEGPYTKRQLAPALRRLAPGKNVRDLLDRLA